MTGHHAAPPTGSAAREATASPYVGEHLAKVAASVADGELYEAHAAHGRQCARCSGYIDEGSGFYCVSKFPPGYRPAPPPALAGVTMLFFDGLDHLREYVTASDEAFPVRQQKMLVAPHVYRLCDWCQDLHWGPGKGYGVFQPCNHVECQCWCVT